MITPPTIELVAHAYALGPVRSAVSGGGTASPKWAIRTDAGQFFIRTRPAEFASDPFTRFDHACLRRLHHDGLPVPQLLSRPDGSTWLDSPDARFELFSWLDGTPYDEADSAQLASIASFLARLHQTLFFPAGKENFRREDHPAALGPYLDALATLPRADQRRPELLRLEHELDQVKDRLSDNLYASLPMALTHGDFHFDNVRFRDGQLSAVYDFDYLSRQARIRDLSDALLFFASRRQPLSDMSAIHRLTRPMTPDPNQCRTILRAYQSAAGPLTDGEWQSLPWLMRSRWLQIRLRGSRKIPPPNRLAFVLDDLFAPLDWLDAAGPSFFADLAHPGQ